MIDDNNNQTLEGVACNYLLIYGTIHQISNKTHTHTHTHTYTHIQFTNTVLPFSLAIISFGTHFLTHKDVRWLMIGHTINKQTSCLLNHCSLHRLKKVACNYLLIYKTIHQISKSTHTHTHTLTYNLLISFRQHFLTHKDVRWFMIKHTNKLTNKLLTEALSFTSFTEITNIHIYYNTHT